MSKRVHEVATELGINNKELIEKLRTLGIEAKSHLSVIDDKDVIIVRNQIKSGETESVNKPVKEIKETQPKEEKQAVQPSANASVGRPTPKPTVVAPNGKVMLQGKPMPKNTVPQMKKTPEVFSEKEKQEQSVVIAVPEVKEQGKNMNQEVKKETVKEIVKTPVKEIIKEEPKADIKSEAPKVETPKPKVSNPEKPKSEVVKKATPKAPVSDYVDHRPTLKIIKRAADIEIEERAAREKQQAEMAARKAAQAEKQKTERKFDPKSRSGNPGQRPYQKPGEGRTQGGPSQTQNGQGNKFGDRPKPSTGFNKERAPINKDKDADGPVRHDHKVGEKKKAVLVYDAPMGLNKPSKKRDKDKKDKDKLPQGRVIDLTKAAPKKHRKSKEKVVDQVEENNVEVEALPLGTKMITVPITVKGLAEQIEATTSQLIMALMKLGIMANVNQNLDEDTAILLGGELGINIVVSKVNEEVVEDGLELFEDKLEELKARPPIIAVMGHVDHGKTSLLDAIRKTNVTDREAGGITQHIGASEVVLKGHKIVFLDTPGHEAFTAMRARGAHVTDIAILVVAADDSVKPQTIESISHAKAAGVPIIVAMNKMDKPGANPDQVKKDLSEHGILVEEWGGDTICVPVSAKTGEGIVNLLEMILLQAEVLELKANPNRMAMGTVIEARLDKAKGPVATLLVTNGTIQAGMSIVAGTCSGKIRAMTNFKGDSIRKAGPATAVEILGLTDVPEAGDEFNALKEDKVAREIAENRKMKLREEVMTRNSSTTLEQLFSQIEEGETKELNLIIKADVQGSVGALNQSLEKLQNENVKVKIIHSGVGTVTESDIMLASTSSAIIIGFNVRPSTAISNMADREGVEIRTYRIIYEAIGDIEAAMKGMLDPIYKEVVLGKIEIRNTFKVPGVGLIAGAYVLEGKVQRNAQIRLVRDGIVIHEGKISSLKRFKDDVKEVAHGFECGIGIENYNDLKEGDIIEAFTMEEVERK